MCPHTAYRRYPRLTYAWSATFWSGDYLSGWGCGVRRYRPTIPIDVGWGGKRTLLGCVSDSSVVASRGRAVGSGLLAEGVAPETIDIVNHAVEDGGLGVWC